MSIIVKLEVVCNMVYIKEVLRIKGVNVLAVGEPVLYCLAEGVLEH